MIAASMGISSDMIKSASFLCQYCKSQSNKVDKENAVRIDNKNFHSNCAKLYLDKKELQETICRIFNLKAPGPKNNAYISKFHNEGMTFKGMTHTLVYFYEIKKNSIEKSNDGIGIIPYVYDEARKFYENNGFICTDNVLDDNIGGKDLKEIMYMLN